MPHGTSSPANVAHVICRLGETEPAAMFTADDLHDLYSDVADIKDLIAQLMVLLPEDLPASALVREYVESHEI